MIKEVHIFKAGTQTSAQGITREFTKNDLEQIAKSYKPDVHEAPIRIGHDDNDKVPAWGWVKGVKVKGDELFAEIDFSPLATDYIKNGLYKKVSASFYSPDSKINPEPGKWSLRHVALLGAQPPAVKGLKGFAYEENADGVLDFATTLSPDQVFDDELGPTLKRDQGPLEILKEKLDEARLQMTTEQKAAAPDELEANSQIEEENVKEPVDGEFAEGDMMGHSKKKKSPTVKMGEEGDEEEVDEDDDEDTVKSKEMDGSKLPPALMKNAAKKKAAKEGISEEDAMMEHKNSKKMSFKGSDSEDHEEVETADGEGPVASKVKKNKQSGAAADEVEDDDKKFEEPTFEPSKKKRGTDGLNSSEVGVKETDGGPGGLVRTRSSSKGINLGFEEPDDEQHAEDNDDYTKRSKVGKADKEGETGRGMSGKAPEIKGYPDGSGKDSMKGESPDDWEDAYTDDKAAKNGEQEADRKKTGKSKELAGYPGKYMSTGLGNGSGKQVKGGKVRVMTVNHSEGSDQIAEMMARLEELETANARLREQADFAERQASRMRLEQFAEGLYGSGKLTEAVVTMDELVDYMEGLEHGTLEFSEGESAATPLMKILSSLPAQVCFEEVAGGEVVMSEDALDPHERALKLAKEESIQYTEALKQVLYSV